jgi:glutamine amidotransferase
MGSLRASGLDATLEAHRAAGRPLLGVCVGFQAMFARGTEFGEHAGLGWFAGSVDRFAPGLHVPHVGWNRVAPVEGRDGPLWRGLEAGWFAYFVHSYRPTGVDEADIAATTEYGGSFASAVARDHVAGVQFHPEKSGPDGLRLLSNFVAWSP